MDALAEMPKYKSYKNSGADWLGDIPDEWNVKRIKFLFLERNERSKDGSEELLSVSQYTGVTRKSDKTGAGDLLTNAESLEGYKKVEVGELVSNIMLAWNGSLGFSPHGGIVSPAYSVYKLKNGNDQKYFHYLLRTEIYKAEYKRRSSGVIDSRLRLYTDDFYDVLGLLPPPNEQTCIANFLDSKTAQIDEAIAIKEKQIRLLKERKQIIIQKAVTQGLNPNALMKDSEVEWIGQIPEHWSVKKLKYMVNFVGGGTPSKDNQEYWGGNISWVSPKDMKYDSISSSIDTITDLAVKKSSVKLIPKGAILIVVRGMILARKIPVAIADKELTINQDMKAMLVDHDQCAPLFLRLLLDGLHEELSTLLEESGHGTKTFPTDKLAGFSLPIPPKDEQNDILKFIDKASNDILELVLLQEHQIEKLKEYKTTLINSAVTGKIKVA